MNIKRMCVECGKKLDIIVNEDKSYTGGHFFFGKGDGLDAEYWECDECFNKEDGVVEEVIGEVVLEDVEVVAEKKKCPECGTEEFTIIAGGCGQRSMMAHLCKNGHRWNA